MGRTAAPSKGTFHDRYPGNLMTAWQGEIMTTQESINTSGIHPWPGSIPKICPCPAHWQRVRILAGRRDGTQHGWHKKNTGLLLWSHAVRSERHFGKQTYWTPIYPPERNRFKSTRLNRPDSIEPRSVPCEFCTCRSSGRQNSPGTDWFSVPWSLWKAVWLWNSANSKGSCSFKTVPVKKEVKKTTGGCHPLPILTNSKWILVLHLKNHDRNPLFCHAKKEEETAVNLLFLFLL